MRRTLTWLVTLPFAAASVLVAHELAYRVAGASGEGMHGYLDHAPAVVLVLTTAAVLGLAVDTRAQRRSPLPLATVGIVAFVLQEHLERLVHTGHVPFLLLSPVLWLGIVLQLPLTVAIWLLARQVAADIAAVKRRGARALARLPLVLAAPPQRTPAPVRARRGRTRGPPRRP